MTRIGLAHHVRNWPSIIAFRSSALQNFADALRHTLREMTAQELLLRIVAHRLVASADATQRFVLSRCDGALSQHGELGANVSTAIQPLNDAPFFIELECPLASSNHCPYASNILAFDGLHYAKIKLSCCRPTVVVELETAAFLKVRMAAIE